MTTPPILEAPSSMCAASVVISLKHVIGSTASPFTLERQSFRWPGEQWMVDFRLPPRTSRAVFEEWIAFALELKGSWGTFLMGLPLHDVPQGVATGVPLVDGAGQTGGTLLTKGWTNGVTGILKKGDCIQLGTGSTARLHKLLNTPNSDGSGKASLKVTPDIVTAPADSAAIVVNNPRGLFRMVENTVSWSIDPGPVYRLSFQAMGVI